jgi:hypothetical protein
MMNEQIAGIAAIKGRARPGRVYPVGNTRIFQDTPNGVEAALVLPGLWVPEGTWEDNLTLYDWAEIYGQLMRGEPDGRQYRIGGMYIEFENNGGAAVSPPSFDRSGGKSYYDSLSSSGTRDYLRVPMTGSTIADDGNGKKITFFAQTAGVTGVHGKTFSDTVSSRVYAAALVAFPEGEDDSSLDIVHSRFNYDTAANQLIKQAGSQITVTWPLTLN